MVDFITSEINPEKIIAFKASDQLQQRAEELILKEKVARFQLKKNPNLTIICSSNIL